MTIQNHTAFLICPTNRATLAGGTPPECGEAGRHIKKKWVSAFDAALAGLHEDIRGDQCLVSGPLCYIDGSHTVQLHKGATHGILGFDTRQLDSRRVSAIEFEKDRGCNSNAGMRRHHAPLNSCDRPRLVNFWLCSDDAFARPWRAQSETERACRSCGVSPACCAAYPDCQPAERSSAKAAFLAALSFSRVVRGPVFTVLRISDRLLSSSGEFGPDGLPVARAKLLTIYPHDRLNQRATLNRYTALYPVRKSLRRDGKFFCTCCDSAVGFDCLFQVLHMSY